MYGFLDNMNNGRCGVQVDYETEGLLIGQKEQATNDMVFGLVCYRLKVWSLAMLIMVII